MKYKRSSYDTWLNVLTGISLGSFDTVYLRDASGNVVVLRHSNAHSLGIAHLILWAPLLFALVKYEIKQDDFKFASIYGVWLSLVMITISVSLVFDIRDIAMIGLGYK